MVKALTYFKAEIIEVEESPTLLSGDGDSLSNDIVLQAGDNNLVLTVTEQEYVEMLSALYNGAKTTYPEKWISVIYPLIKAGKVDFCTAVLNCIETNTEVQEAIAEYSGTTTNQLTDTPEQEILDSDTLSEAGIVTCQNDNLFGAITGLVDLMNDLAEDFIEIMTANTNSVGRMGDVIEMIPVFETLPVDDLLQIVEGYMEDLEQNYQASYTVALRDDYRCDLFCISKDACELDFEQIFDYFRSQLQSSFTMLDLEDLFEWLLQGFFTGTELVHAWHTLISGLMLFGSKVLNVDYKRIVTMVSAMYNDPDSDWSILCSCGWTWNSDFANSSNIWLARNFGFGDLAFYNTGVNWESVDGSTSASNDSRILAIETPEFTPTEIGQITLNYDYTKGTFNSNTQAVILKAIKNDDTSVTLTINSDQMSSGTDKTEVLNVNESDIKRIQVYIRCSSTPNTGYSGSLNLNTLQITGANDNPFD